MTIREQGARGKPDTGMFGGFCIKQPTLSLYWVIIDYFYSIHYFQVAL